MNRRSFLLGLLSSTAAPAIAEAMPTIGVDLAFGSDQTAFFIRTGLPTVTWRKLNEGVPWSQFDLIHNGIPIREVAELLKQENEVLKTIYGPFPNLTDDDNYLDDDDV